MTLADQIAAAQRKMLCAIAELYGWGLFYQMSGMGQTKLVAEHPVFGTLEYA